MNEDPRKGTSIEARDHPEADHEGPSAGRGRVVRKGDSQGREG